MANKIYPLAKEKFIKGAIDLTSVTLKIVLVKSTYTYNDAHEFLSDLGANTLGTAVALATKTTNSPTPGVFDAADPTFTSVPVGTVNAYALYVDTGTAGTSSLVYYCDGTTGFPLSTTGGDVTVALDNGANRIFAI